MQAFFVVLNMPGNGCNIYVLDCTGSDFSRAETKLGHWVSLPEEVLALGLPVRFEWGSSCQIHDVVDLYPFIDLYAKGLLKYPETDDWCCCYG